MSRERTIHREVKALCTLAAIYAEDGAFASAVAKLNQAKGLYFDKAAMAGQPIPASAAQIQLYKAQEALRGMLDVCYDLERNDETRAAVAKAKEVLGL